MNFFKTKGKILFITAFGIFLIVQQIAISYGRSYREQAEVIDRTGNDKLALDEVRQLETVWRKAAVEDLITPEKLADVNELKRARKRLEEAEIGIQQSEKRTRGITGKKSEFIQKIHAYYHHSVSSLISIIDFLFLKQGEYVVKGNEIDFESEADGERFRELINRLSYINQEKQELDAYIILHNKEVENKLSI